MSLARFITATLLTIAAHGAAADMTDPAVREACTQLARDYAWYRDHQQGHAERYAALFTADATLTILGETWNGREAIVGRFTASASAPRTIHLPANIRIEQTSASSARGTSYATVYVLPDGTDPVVVAGAAMVGEYHDEYRLTDRGWQIAKRTFVPRFTDPAFVPPAAPAH